MKRKWLAVWLTIAVALALTACGEAEEPAQAPTVQSTEQADMPEETEAAENEAQTPKVQEADATETEPVQNAQAQGNVAADTESPSESQAFAQSIKDAVEAKDLEALAGLFTYPSYAADYEDPESGHTLDSREDLIALGADIVFTEDLLASIEAVDPFAVTEVKAGYVMMGTDKAAIIYNTTKDGGFGITGLSY